MRRRTYLVTTAGILSIAGCSESSDDTNGGGTQDTTEKETNTETQTEPGTTTSGGETFEIVEIVAPEQVQAGEPHTYTIRVRNTGDEQGTFEATLEVSTADTTRWEEAGPVQIENIPPGEIGEFTPEEFTFDEAYQLQYRLAEYDVEWSYDIVVPQPNIAVGESSLLQVDTGYETRPMAGVLVTNDGDSPTKQLEVTADWLDSNGDYIASSTASIQTLGVDETWSARIDPNIDVDDYSAIDDFEISVGNAAPATSLNPDDVTLSGVELRASESQVLVRGQVQNKRDSTLGYVEVVAKVYNAAGDVIGWKRTNETDVSPGDVLRFELEPDTKGRNGDVESHKAVVADSTLSF